MVGAGRVDFRNFVFHKAFQFVNSNLRSLKNFLNIPEKDLMLMMIHAVFGQILAILSKFSSHPNLSWTPSPPPKLKNFKNFQKNGWKESFYPTFETDWLTCVIILGSWYLDHFHKKGQLQTSNEVLYWQSKFIFLGKTKSISILDRMAGLALIFGGMAGFVHFFGGMAGFVHFFGGMAGLGTPCHPPLLDLI